MNNFILFSYKNNFETVFFNDIRLIKYINKKTYVYYYSKEKDVFEDENKEIYYEIKESVRIFNMW